MHALLVIGLNYDTPGVHYMYIEQLAVLAAGGKNMSFRWKISAFVLLL